MPDFEWKKTEPLLTKTIQAGGLGMSATDVTSITIQQTRSDWVFNWHTGYHGSDGGGHYVYVRENDSKSKNLPRAWISGPKAGMLEGAVGAKASVDVKAVVANANNRTLLLAACKRYNGVT